MRGGLVRRQPVRERRALRAEQQHVLESTMPAVQLPAVASRRMFESWQRRTRVPLNQFATSKADGAHECFSVCVCDFGCDFFCVSTASARSSGI